MLLRTFIFRAARGAGFCATARQRLTTMAAAPTKTVNVTVYSDLACPWCYVGQQRLDKALAGMPEVATNKEWHAFLLDPHFNPEGEPIEVALRKKFGERGPALMDRIKEAGREDGATFANWRWRSNTIKAHMLVALARQHGKSHEANQALFRKSYEEGANLSDTEVVLEVGRQLGLPEDELKRLSCEELDPELLREVREDDMAAKTQLQVSGVPFFLISSGDSRMYALSGAQPPEAFQEAIQLALKEGGSGTQVARGAACTRDGCA